MSFNVKEGEGLSLSKEYKVGHTYPVFILTNSAGDIIYRWTGYTGAQNFISSLNKSLKDLTTVKDRIRSFQSHPTQAAAVMLARYFSDTGEHLEAIRFYREAKKLKRNPAADFSYDIFSNSANAAWKEMTPFEDVLPAADSVLYSRRKSPTAIIKVAKIMSRLGRKLDKEDQIKKYLQAGIDLTADKNDNKSKSSNSFLTVEYALQIEHDTTRALQLKKMSMGQDWQKSPEKFYTFAKWCLERKINLKEAEMLARKATQYARGEDFKAQVFHTVAEICFVRGNLEDAIKFGDLAIENDPGNINYSDAMDIYLENWGKK